MCNKRHTQSVLRGNFLLLLTLAALVGCSQANGTYPPSTKRAEVMAEHSLEQLGKAINARDFSEFHKSISNSWASKVDAEGFLELFKPYIDKNVDLLKIIETHAPILSEKPALSEEGVLSVNGYYPSEPLRLTFELDYVFEDNSWQLKRTHVALKPLKG